MKVASGLDDGHKMNQELFLQALSPEMSVFPNGDSITESHIVPSILPFTFGSCFSSLLFDCT